MIRAAALLLCACATVPKLTGPGCPEGFDARERLAKLGGPVDLWSTNTECIEGGRYRRSDADGMRGIDEGGPWMLGPSGVPLRLTHEEGAELYRARWRLKRAFVDAPVQQVRCEGERVLLTYQPDFGETVVELAPLQGAPSGSCTGMPRTGPYRLVWPAGKSYVRVALPEGVTLDPSVQEPPGTQLLDLGGVRVETFNGRVLGRSFFESVGVRVDVRAHELTLYPGEAVHSDPDDEAVSFALDAPLPDTSHCTTVTWDFRHRTVWLEREGRRRADLAGLGLAGAQVVWVFPLGPAAAAGLESGDELVSVNGGSDFDAPFRQAAGARVRVVFRRGQVQRETIVTLKRWQQ